MAADRQKLRLSENHRRVVSVLLRGVEQTCHAVAGWLDKKPGVLIGLENDLSPQQCQRLCALVDQLQAEIRRLSGAIDLQRSAESPRRSIHALISAMRVEIEERKSPRLKGYGPLDDVAAAVLDAELDRLLELFEKMAEVVK